MFGLFKFWRETPKVRTFAEVLKEYIDRYVLENQITQETAARYAAYYRNSANFFSENRLWKLQMNEIREVHAEKFRSWLRTTLKTCSIRHASRHVELWKNVSKYAVKMEYADNDRLSPIKAQRDPKKKIVTLDMSEIRRLQKYEFQPGIMRIVTDLFLFQCFTGLSYADIYKHRLEYRKGKYWIVGEREKTGREYRTPVLDEAAEIYMRYEAHMPQLSNQKYNEYLKEVAALVGIRKRLTTHVGRKTFATLLTIRGANTKPLSMMLGNTPRVCDEDYIDPVPEIVEEELRRLNLGSSLLP